MEMDLEKKPLHIYIPRPSFDEKKKIYFWLFAVSAAICFIVGCFYLWTDGDCVQFGEWCKTKRDERGQSFVGGSLMLTMAATFARSVKPVTKFGSKDSES